MGIRGDDPGYICYDDKLGGGNKCVEIKDDINNNVDQQVQTASNNINVPIIEATTPAPDVESQLFGDSGAIMDALVAKEPSLKRRINMTDIKIKKKKPTKAELDKIKSEIEKKKKEVEQLKKAEQDDARETKMLQRLIESDSWGQSQYLQFCWIC